MSCDWKSLVCSLQTLPMLKKFALRAHFKYKHGAYSIFCMEVMILSWNVPWDTNCYRCFLKWKIQLILLNSKVIHKHLCTSNLAPQRSHKRKWWVCVFYKWLPMLNIVLHCICFRAFSPALIKHGIWSYFCQLLPARQRGPRGKLSNLI